MKCWRLLLLMGCAAVACQAGAATYVVTNALDAGPGSLRQAVWDANANPGRDTIQFNLAPPGPHIIRLWGEGLRLSDPVVLDGSTQPGFAGQPVIVLAGVDVAGPGLVLATSNSVIRSLVLSNFGGAGVLITGAARDNLIGGTNAAAGNVIVSNGWAGVEVLSGTNNAVRGNAIFGNGGLGIDLGGNGPTPNDDKDPDTGPNQLQNYPVLTSATINSNGIVVAGSLNSRPSVVFQLDFYASLAGDESGFGEGQTWLGSRAITNTSGGTVTFNFTLPLTLAGRYITATATDPAGNTSEFSPWVRASTTLAPMVFEVNNTNDAGSGSLRQALLEAANRPATGPHTIRFALPGWGVRVIAPGSPLPPIIEPVVLDGYSQPGAALNTLSNGFNATLLVQLDGSAAGPDAFGLTLLGDGSTVRGLVLVNFGAGGIQVVGGRSNLITGNVIGLVAATSGGPFQPGDSGGSGVWLQEAAFNTIGGLAASHRNIISAHRGDGIGIEGAGATGNQVLGNFIGTDPTGRVGWGNDGWGVRLDGGASGNVIGGTVAGAGNLIAWNGSGLLVSEGVSNRIQGNLIGADVTGTNALGNGTGVVLFDASFNQIGGTNPAAANLIVGNGQGGVVAWGLCNSNVIQGNFIGTDPGARFALGNEAYGVFWEAGVGNRIGGTEPGAGNTMAFNRGPGVAILSGRSHALLGNAIFNNEGLGIDLGDDGVTPNDPGDTDFGANDLQNFPELSRALIYADRTVISGRLESRPGVYRLELFASKRPDPSGYGQGRTVLTNATVTVPSGGVASFTVTNLAALTPGFFVTATATDATNNTSEFSAAVMAVPFDSVDLAVRARDSADPVGLGSNFTYTITVTNAGPATATGVTVVDSLPAALSFVSAWASQGSCSHVAGTVTCQLGTLTNGGAATVLLTVYPTRSGSVTNVVSVSANQADPILTNNAALEPTLLGLADLAVSLSAGPNPVRTGELLTSTLTVSNRGPDTVWELVISNTMAGLPGYLVSATASQGTVSYSGLSAWCRLGPLPAGGSATLTLGAACTGTGALQHRGGVAGGVWDANPANNFAQLSTTVTAGPGLLVFEPPAYIGSEREAWVSLAVVRQGGGLGTIGVSFTTSNGTATAGQDFEAVSGALTFGPGQTRQVIAVPLIRDLLPECNETFSLHLFQPIGGFVLAGPTRAQVTIADDDVEPRGLLAGVSVRADNPQAAGNDLSGPFSLSPDGRYVAFASLASDLAPGDLNNASDIFVRDLASGLTRLITTNRLGTSANGPSVQPALAAQGRYVAFCSGASDLVTNSMPASANVFRHDRLTGQTVLISLSTDNLTGGNAPAHSPAINADGSRVAFVSDGTDLAVVPNPDGFEQVFVRHVAGGTNALISLNRFGTRAGNGDSSKPLFSPDGRYLAFESTASDLVAGDTNEVPDLFVRDLSLGVTLAINLNATGSGTGNGRSCCGVFSADGRYLAFYSEATDLVPGGTGTAGNIFLRDLVAGTTELISANPAGLGGNGPSWRPAISADGRYVAFASDASDLVPGDLNGARDIFLRDRLTGTTTLVSVNCSGFGSGNGDSDHPVLSADGAAVAFLSRASDLAPGECPPGTWQLFRRDRLAGTTALVSLNSSLSGAGDDNASAVRLSADGRVVVFASAASDLVAQDWNGAEDIFAWTAPEPGAAADLAVSLGVPEPVAPFGQQLRLTLLVTNRGPAAAHGVTLWTLVPERVFILNADTSQGSLAIEDPVARADFGRLPANGSATLTLWVATAGLDLFTNSARVAALEPDPQPANNLLIQTVACPSANLALSLRVQPNPVGLAAPLTCTFTVTNLGPNRATGLVLTNRPPAGLTFLSAAASAGSCFWNGSLLTCSLDALEPQTAVTFTLLARAAALGTFTNVARVTALSCDPSLVNNTGTAAIQIVPLTQPQLRLENVDGRLTLTWSETPTATFLLETATNLTPPIAWITLSNAASPLLLTNAPAEPARFFRLRLP